MKLRSALLAATVLAAAPIAAKAQAVSGLYIGAGAGVNFLQREPISSTTFPGVLPTNLASSLSNSPQSVRSQVGFAGVLSVGYGLGNGLRFEIEGDARDNKLKNSNAANINGTRIGVGGDEIKYGGMFNALYDFDFGFPVVPYVGVGVGYQWAQEQNFRAYTGQFGTGGLASLYRTNQGDGAFAYQGIVGAAFPIAAVPGLSLTAEYRYLGMTGDRTLNAQYLANRPAPLGTSTAAKIKFSDETNHTIMVGLRYAFNAAPPPPPAAVVTPPPAREAARTYLVFFDWDRADLTPRARQVVSEAAQATTRVQVTRIQVNGYTDTSGTPRYNQGLSVRRAQTVANELVRDGVPRSAISIQGFGETHLLVPTADGVREPQNRRVEIILQ
jgi:outer membrane protein OmpA-like peptidoglycan-associated protein